GDLRAVARVGDLVALLGDDQALLRTEPDVQPAEVVLAVIVVLEEHGDLRVRGVLPDPLAVRAALRDVVGLPPDRPRELLVLEAPVARARRDEHLRDLPLVEDRSRSLRGLRAERPDVREDLVV